MSCFLQGIKFGSPNSRSHLARVLYLLSFDSSNEPVGRAFDKYLDQVPHWVWLSWIPQLLLSLQRTEAPHCKLVLLKIATVYPQVGLNLLLEIINLVFNFNLSSMIPSFKYRHCITGCERICSNGVTLQTNLKMVGWPLRECNKMSLVLLFLVLLAWPAEVHEWPVRLAVR